MQVSQEDKSSATAATKSLFITAAIKAKEGRDVMTLDIPNAYIQTKMPNVKDDEARVIMKVQSVLVD